MRQFFQKKQPPRYSRGLLYRSTDRLCDVLPGEALLDQTPDLLPGHAVDALGAEDDDATLRAKGGDCGCFVLGQRNQSHGVGTPAQLTFGAHCGTSDIGDHVPQIHAFLLLVMFYPA